MFFDKFELLNQYDAKKYIYLVSISCPKITEFNQYYQYVYKRVKELDNSELTESFSSTLKRFFNKIRITVEPYDEVLKNYKFDELDSFFTQLVETDYEEKTENILRKLANLIKRFSTGDIRNQIREQFLYYHELYRGNNVVVTYYPPYDSQIKYRSIYNYFKDSKFYDNAFFLGTPNFYGDNTIFKANQTFYLSYDIYSMNFNQKKIIENNSDENCSIYRDIEIIKVKEEGSVNQENVSEELVFEKQAMKLNLYDIKKAHIRKNSADTLVTRASLVTFKSDNFMFFTQTSKLNVLNKKNGIIESKNLKESNSNEWLVIRTSSDEEYLTNEARKEIGSNYDKYYDEVTKYKDILQFKIKNEYYTLERLVKELKKSGITVSKQLLMQWIYGDTVAPRETNYYKILKFLDYKESEINLLNNYYKVIISARRSAGKKLNDVTQKVIDSIEIDNIREHMYENNLYEFTHMYGEYRIEEILFIDTDTINIETNDLYKIKSIKNRKKINYKNNFSD